MDATLIFCGDVVDLLRVRHDRGRVAWPVRRRASVKDVAESLGAPHTEIHAIRVDGQPAGFGHLLEPGQVARIEGAVRPVDLFRDTLLRPALPSAAPAGEPPAPAFLVDENVAKLAMLLRLVGHDAAHDRAWDDPLIAETAQAQGRLVLTRDTALLKRSKVVHGRLIRSVHPRDQLLEVMALYGLSPRGAAFTRCLRCNALLAPVDKAEVLPRLLPKTRKYYDEFHLCPGCGRVYWPGSHHAFLSAFVAGLGVK